jgi:hypothetical protein
MVTFLGYALIFVVAVGMLFMLAVFQAAAVEVRRKPRFTLMTMEAAPAPGPRDDDRDLAHAA